MKADKLISKSFEKLLERGKARGFITHEELKKSYEQFSTSRNDFIKSMHDGTIQEQWQKNYFQGKMPDGSRCPIQNHQTKLSLNLEEK